MAARNAGCVGGSRPGPSSAPANCAMRLTEGGEDELVRIFLPPFESGFFPIHSQMQIVFISRRNLARPKASFGPVRKAQHHVNIVVEAPPWNERGHIGRHVLAS